MSIAKSIIVLLVAVIVFVGCKKEEIVDPPAQKKFLSQVVSDSNDYRKFYYSNNRFEKYESVEDGKIVLSVLYSYDSKGRVETEKVENNGSIKDTRLYEYFYNNDGLVDKVEFRLLDSGSYQMYGYFILYYNGNDQLISREYYNNENVIRERIEYEYNAEGDCIKQSWFVMDKQPDSLYEVRTYEYDSNVNPESDLGITFGKLLVMGKHNPIKVTTETFLSLYLKNVTTNNYIYDSEGYPIKRNRVYSDNQGFTYSGTETYIYQ